MILSVSNQAGLFLTSVAIGLLIGFFYDWIRILRIIIKHIEIITYIEDVLYWLIASLAVFFVILQRNDGDIRAFIVFGTLLGMTLYFCTISFYFIKVSSTVINLIKKTLRILLDIILAPIMLVYKILLYPARFAKRQFMNVKKIKTLGKLFREKVSPSPFKKL